MVRVGKDEIVSVLRVDKDKGYIDLSKRRVNDEDKKKCENRYEKAKVLKKLKCCITYLVQNMLLNKKPDSESVTLFAARQLHPATRCRHDRTDESGATGRVV